jgi:hypothetical protein
MAWKLDNRDITIYSKVVMLKNFTPSLIMLLTISLVSNDTIAQLQVIATSTAGRCPGSGSITATAINGTSPHQFRLTDGINVLTAWQSGNVFNSLSSGNYFVEVKDASNATALSDTQKVIINYTEMSNISSSIATVMVGSCAQRQVTINVSNGRPPYNYELL